MNSITLAGNTATNTSPRIQEGDENNPRKRQRTACDRCKSRKQRCDNAHPKCGNCTKSNHPCTRPPDWEAHSQSYTRALEDQVAYLETRLLAIEEQQNSQPYAGQIDETVSPDVRADDAQAIQTADTVSIHQNVADIVGMLSLGSGNVETANYIGSSSGYGLATDLGRMVQATVWNKALWIPDSSGSLLDGQSPGAKRTRKITVQELQSTPSPPNEGLSTRLIDAYLVRIHPRFPFLFRSDLWEAHRLRQVLVEESAQKSFQEASTFSSPAYENPGYALFVLYMVYAIGALNLRLTEEYRETSPEQFYVYAMRHVASVREASPVHNLEATVLLILYHLRSESRNGLWHLTGLAMRTVTEVGLHREASTRGLPVFQAQLRRRLFWSVYALESILASTLGRPISLSDCDIDQPLPFSIDDNDRMYDYIQELPQNTMIPTNLTQFILLSQLHRFEARIQRAVYRVDREIETLEPKMRRLLSELEEWIHQVPAVLEKGDRDRIMLHYHRNIRLLLQPFLATMDPASPCFRKCADAAGQICQIHKRLHQTPEYGHSFVAVHTVFVSGITLLYVLWRGKETIWSFGISNEIRAASCVLAIMGERAPWIRRFRDAFDILVEATMTVLQGNISEDKNKREQATTAQTDFSFLDELYIADCGALEIARELVDSIQH